MTTAEPRFRVSCFNHGTLREYVRLDPAFDYAWHQRPKHGVVRITDLVTGEPRFTIRSTIQGGYRIRIGRQE